ncbi:MAG TPA: 2,3-bisphosphoglycerate-independent phosphoglycerate mutase [Thermoplasmata archaeon]|nr:2,3-bisphosphoglycerate-independent phosphoglycerate mutase [Thermoplasmata archaeon]
MVSHDVIKSLVVQNDAKILLVVMDGLGGLPINGKTELEAAKTPNLDSLASKSVCGLTHPVSPGITPGSGPAHFSLFGYDPLEYEIGRGVLEALGLGIQLNKSDVVARGNFATRKGDVVIDRRAGRLPTQENKRICGMIQNHIREIDGVKISLNPGKEHRFALVLRGNGLDPALSENDPQKDNQKIRQIISLNSEAWRTALVVNKFLDKANKLLKNEHPANALLLRGFSSLPDIPSIKNLYKLKAVAIATYPMYKGLAKLVGMKVLECGETLEDELKCLKEKFSSYDFFYFHIKKTDSYGEDGNFKQKVKYIEEIDGYIPQLLDLKPDVLAITGDHSTPSLLKSHSWHPNPLLLCSERCRTDDVKKFSEKECIRGGLGIFHSVELMPLMLANALKLQKFGA